jgi:hypothetical protein
MEELLVLIRNLTVDPNYELTMVSITKLNDLQHVVLIRDNREWCGEGNEKMIRIEISKRNEPHLNQCFANLMFNAVFKTDELLRSTLVVMDQTNTKVIDTLGVEGLKMLLYYDMTGHFPWLTNYPHLFTKKKFVLHQYDKESNSEFKFVSLKIARLIDYCYNNDDKQNVPWLEEMGRELAWCDKNWLLEHFAIYEFTLVQLEGVHFDFETVQWLSDPENTDNLYFLVKAHYAVRAYHHANSKLGKTNRRSRPSTSKRTDLNGVHVETTLFDMTLDLVFKMPKCYILERFLFWSKQQGINFFLK